MADNGSATALQQQEAMEDEEDRKLVERLKKNREKTKLEKKLSQVSSSGSASKKTVQIAEKESGKLS